MSWRTDYDSGKKVYVGPYLEPGLSSEELRDYFAKFGRIEAVWVARNPAGFAFVTFEDARDAEEACLQLNGTEFAGKRIRVEVARGPRNTNRGPMSERTSRNSYSPAYRRSPSYGQDSPGYNHYHDRGYRSPPFDRDHRRYDGRYGYCDDYRRDSYGRYGDGRRAGGHYSSRDAQTRSRSNESRRKYNGNYRASHSSRENNRSNARDYDERSKRSVSRDRSLHSSKKDHSRSSLVSSGNRETNRNTYVKSSARSSSLSNDERSKGKSSRTCAKRHSRSTSEVPNDSYQD